MKFSQYFNKWVHEKYYASGVKIGKQGDFYTSVSVGYLFGVLLANYFISLVDSTSLSKQCRVVEIGANDGSMMADFIQGVFTLRPELLNDIKFIIIEPHEALMDMQKNTINNRFGSDVEIVHAKSLKDINLQQAFVYSNELFDSFSCELLKDGDMAYVKNDRLYWKKADDEILSLASKINIKQGELSLSYIDFAKDFAKSIKSGRFVSFDYGMWEARGDFSLRVYKNHDVFNFFDIENLSSFFGSSDLTYDVCFSFLSSCFKEHGWQKIAFKSQGLALLQECEATKILDLISQKGSSHAYANAIKQIKFLSHPSFLGERFKFIELKKD